MVEAVDIGVIPVLQGWGRGISLQPQDTPPRSVPLLARLACRAPAGHPPSGIWPHALLQGASAQRAAHRPSSLTSEPGSTEGTRWNVVALAFAVGSEAGAPPCLPSPPSSLSLLLLLPPFSLLPLPTPPLPPLPSLFLISPSSLLPPSLLPTPPLPPSSPPLPTPLLRHLQVQTPAPGPTWAVHLILDTRRQ